MRALTAVPAVLVASLACVDVALAAPEAVPMAPIIADGATTVTVQFIATGATKARVKADTGKVGAVTVANGVIRAQYTPPALTSARSIAFTVTADGDSATVQVPAVPGYVGGVELSVEPSVVTPGATALVRIRPRGETPVAAAQRRFLATASTGTIEAPMPAGDGSWIARYTPPKGATAPLPVLVAVADGAATSAIVASTLVPVAVKRNLSFDVKPGSENVLLVGERPYGPVKAAPSGKVAFDVEVDPRTPTALLKSVNPDTSREERTVTLPAGAPQAVFAPGPAFVPNGGAIPLRGWAVDATGAPVGQAPGWASTSGQVTDAAATDGTFTAVLRGATSDATITLDAAGARAERRVRATAALAEVALRADPAELPRGATRLTVEARAKDGSGSAVVGRPPVVTASAGSVGPARDNRDGSYTYTLTLPAGASTVQVGAVSAADASGLPPARLLAWADSPEVAANGRDEATLTLVAVDSLGMPVPGVALKLAAPRGDGRVVPTATTDARGLARVVYTAGTATGLAGVRVEGAGLVTEVPLWQAAGDGVPGPGAALAASDGDAVLAAWRAAAPQLRIGREGAAPVAGPPSAATVSTVPAFTTPGAAILVSVRVVDATGKGVAGRKLTVNAAPATVGKVTDARDGTYTFTAQLPPGVDGPLTITAVADGATGVVQLPTFAQAGAAGASAEASPAVARTKPARSAGRTAAGASLRYGLALANTRGSYAMTSDGGAQLVEDAAYEAPAVGFLGAGGELAWRAAAPAFGDLLVDVRAGVSAEPFRTLGIEKVNVQRDVIAGLRVVRPGGPVRLAAGIAAHYTTGVIFRYADAALTDPTQLNVPLYGARLSLGAEAGNDKLHARLEVAESFAPAPIDTHVGLLVDIGRAENMAIRAGASMDWRNMTFLAGDGSEAKVTQSVPAVRVGVAWTR